MTNITEEEVRDYMRYVGEAQIEAPAGFREGSMTVAKVFGEDEKLRNIIEKIVILAVTDDLHSAIFSAYVNGFRLGCEFTERRDELKRLQGLK